MKIVVLSPHRDDAAFSAGLSIERWLTAGHAVSVLNCFTQSDYAPYSDADSLHPHDRLSFVSALRRREDLAWTKLMGAGLQLYDLDLSDAPVRLACPVDEVLTVAIRAGDRAVERLKGAVAKLARGTPTLAVVAPLGVGEHIDHRVVRQAVVDLTSERPLPVAFYEDLPYAVKLAGSLEALAAAVAIDLQPVFAGPFNGDVEAAVARKRRWANCYDSQVDTAVVEEIAGFAERYGGRERLWANSAWRELDPGDLHSFAE